MPWRKPADYLQSLTTQRLRRRCMGLRAPHSHPEGVTATENKCFAQVRALLAAQPGRPQIHRFRHYGQPGLAAPLRS